MSNILKNNTQINIAISIAFLAFCACLAGIGIGIIHGWSYAIVLLLYSGSLLPISISIFLYFSFYVNQLVRADMYRDAMEIIFFYGGCFITALFLGAIIVKGVSIDYIISMIINQILFSYLMLYRLLNIKFGEEEL